MAPTKRQTTQPSTIMASLLMSSFVIAMVFVVNLPLSTSSRATSHLEDMHNIIQKPTVHGKTPPPPTSTHGEAVPSPPKTPPSTVHGKTPPPPSYVHGKTPPPPSIHGKTPPAKSPSPSPAPSPSSA
uniref:leucine-rich repeat extensin-like protein 3 n=1 Tax=Erigeron canadensis TaxID=72917 RepID=UPI001CB89916|nr:leucine-rich repeat extensin-like protein 3 [Erigeron canadensis]